MKHLLPIQRTPECLAHVIRSNGNVVMYDVTIDHEIIGYFVGVNTPDPSMIEFTTREDADIFYDKLNVRVEMANRGICLN